MAHTAQCNESMRLLVVQQPPKSKTATSIKPAKLPELRVPWLPDQGSNLGSADLWRNDGHGEWGQVNP